MKTLKLSVVALMILGAAACSKNNGSNGPTSTTTATTDVAADLVTASLAVNAQGSIGNVNDVTVSAQAKINLDSLCGTTWADSVSRSITLGSFSYSYKAKNSYSVQCTTPSVFAGTVDINTSYSDSYSGPRVKSASSGSAAFAVSGLGRASALYSLTGEYKRSGSFQSKIDSTYNGTHNVDIVFTQLTYTKSGRSIKSGTATFTISGDMPKRGSFSYTGTIVFKGGNSASLTINGYNYIINIETGDKVRV